MSLLIYVCCKKSIYLYLVLSFSLFLFLRLLLFICKLFSLTLHKLIFHLQRRPVDLITCKVLILLYYQCAHILRLVVYPLVARLLLIGNRLIIGLNSVAHYFPELIFDFTDNVSIFTSFSVLLE